MQDPDIVWYYSISNMLNFCQLTYQLNEKYNTWMEIQSCADLAEGALSTLAYRRTLGIKSKCIGNQP